MILLGIDTATEMTSLGLCKYGEPPWTVTLSSPRHQLELIGVVVEQLFENSGISRSQLSAVAVDVGPGLFTGLRVGISFAKSIAGALGIPIVPVTSLDVLAFSQRNCPKTIISTVDARRGEVFYASYRKVPGGGIARISDYAVGSPEAVATEIESMTEPVLMVGQGSLRYKEIFSARPQVYFAGSAAAYPLISMLFEIAFPMTFSEEFISPENVDVVYIRDADARVNFEVRHALGKDR